MKERIKLSSLRVTTTEILTRSLLDGLFTLPKWTLKTSNAGQDGVLNDSISVADSSDAPPLTLRGQETTIYSNLNSRHKVE